MPELAKTPVVAPVTAVYVVLIGVCPIVTVVVMLIPLKVI
jgi:hypothetical protein